MLATPWPAPFDDPEWWFEPKWDGFRCLVATTGTGVELSSRRGLDLGERFAGLTRLNWPTGCVFDGEVVAFDDDRPSFSSLQQGNQATFVAFDLLVDNTGELIGLPLEERRSRLERAGLEPPLLVSPVVAGTGTVLYRAAEERGFEGIVGKRRASTYQPGRRSPDWRKISYRRRLRAAVGGWLPGEGGRRSSFGSLLVGLATPRGLRWIGAVGSGFRDSDLAPVTEALRALERASSPFVDTAGIPRRARWTEPGLVIAVEYKEWTRDHRLRAPVFKGVELPGELPTWDEEGPAQADF